MAVRFKLSLSVVCLGLLAGLLAAGCGSMATRKGFYEPITVELRSGNYDRVATQLEEAKQKGKYDEKDRVVYYLDAGLAYHYAGQYDTSNARLHEAETAAEELFTKSISKAALSLVLNDNALDYAGEDYEVLYANLISALNYLAADNIEDAFVEIRRANLKLDLLDQKYADAAQQFQRGEAGDSSRVAVQYEAKPVRFHNSAFARYLSMHLYAASGRLSDAQLDYELLQHAFASQPFIYDFAPPPVQYASDSGAILSIVALAGLAPVKEALNLRIRTDKDLDLVQVLYDGADSADVEYGHLPIPVSEDYYFKFAIPQLVDQSSVAVGARVFANGQLLGELGLLEDVGSVARETFEAKRWLIYLRSVARAVAKGLVAHKQKEKVDTGGLGGWLKKAAIDVATDISENADLRCARLLPGKILVGDFVVPPGQYDLTLEFLGPDGFPVASRTFSGCEVTDAGLNLVQAAAPR